MDASRTLQREIAAPSWALLGVEPIRALFEYAGMLVKPKCVAGKGDGHPVVVFPGLASDKNAVALLDIGNVVAFRFPSRSVFCSSSVTERVICSSSVAERVFCSSSVA